MKAPDDEAPQRLQKGKRALALTVATALVLTSMGGVLSTAFAQAVPGPLYNVQVSIQTKSSLPDYFVVSAYNSTGALITTSQSQYPAGSLQLPSGTYFLTATATVQSSYYQPYPAYSNGVVTKGASSPSSPSCCIYVQPLVEYGYVVQKVESSTALTIATKNINDTANSAITVHANLPNGTAAKDAWVSASVLGNWYWGTGPATISMYGTTDSTGSATLVAPNVPLLVSVWASLPVNLPTNTTTIQRTIAGEVVNVTVYWQPTYVSFAGWSLMTPPQSGPSITLHYQQPMYYTGGYARDATGNGAAVPGSAGGVPSSSSASGQGSVVYPGFGPGGISLPSAQSTQTVYVSTGSGSTSTAESSTGSYNTLLFSYLAIGLSAAAVCGVVFVVVRSRRG